VTTSSTRWLVRPIWWIFANTASPRLGTAALGLVLARWVSPGEFGVLAVAVIALLGFQSLSPASVGRAMTTRHDNPYQVAPTVTSISLVIGGAIGGLAYLGAPWYATWMNEPAAAGVVRWLGVSVAISAIATAPAAVLGQPPLRVRQPSHRVRQPSHRAINVLIEGVDNWIAVGVAVYLAAKGHALTGLAAGRIAGSVTRVLVYAAIAPRALRIGCSRSITQTSSWSGSCGPPAP
jgi:hypothetical protein